MADKQTNKPIIHWYKRNDLLNQGTLQSPHAWRLPIPCIKAFFALGWGQIPSTTQKSQFSTECQPILFSPQRSNRLEGWALQVFSWMQEEGLCYKVFAGSPGLPWQSGWSGLVLGILSWCSQQVTGGAGSLWHVTGIDFWVHGPCLESGPKIPVPSLALPQVLFRFMSLLSAFLSSHWSTE